MATPSSRASALRSLSLIFVIQIPLCSALPAAQQGLDPDIHGLNDVRHRPVTETTTIPCSTSTSGPSNVVYQIPDGQVQVSGPAQGSPSLDVSSSSTEASTTSSSSTSVLTVRALSSAFSTTTGIVSSNAVSSETAYFHGLQTSSFSTSVPDSSLTSLSASDVQTATGSSPTSTSGSVSTSLDTSAQETSLPFLVTSIANATHSLSLVDTATLSDVVPSATSVVTALSASDIFQPIATEAPPIPTTTTHPVPTQGIQPQQRKLQTNKFYSSFFLGYQNNAVFTFPYSVAWTRGGTQEVQSWGLAVAHTERDDLVYAPPKYASDTGLRVDAGEWAFFQNRLGTQSIILSASELTNTTDGSYPGLTTENLEWGSVDVNLFPVGWLTPIIRFPLVQGASFITGDYSWGTPLIQTGIGFSSLTYDGAVAANNTFKYTAQLMNGHAWVIYLTPNFALSPGYPVNSLTLSNDSTTSIQGHSGYNGLIQVAKVPSNQTSNSTSVSLYNGAAGAYAASVNISGSVEGTTGSYTFTWTKRGRQDQSLLMFALPHHVASLSYDTSGGITDLQLMTTVKGLATAVRGDSWTLNETDLPIDMDFAPWTPTQGSIKTLSEEAKQAVASAGLAELRQNITAQSNVGSFYYDGKALAKFAAIIYTIHQIVGNETLALTGLLELQKEFAFHVNGQQPYPLVYETVWGGAVSDASYVLNDPGVDFGNTYYNDHHFHFGYFVYAAAVIGYLDQSWLDNSTNVAWVNMLVRDYANSVSDDPYFPFSRSFDWYHGHSWATGLFDQADGKNQESSSEDTMASYAIKMWGQVTGDKNMMARGNLMLAVQARALQKYYLYDSNNTVEPAEFIGNKAAGILFENKIDHTTFFGAQPEYIQGIHMIPIMPFSTYIRTPTLVQQEWDAYFSNYSDGSQPYINRVQGGFRGILEANHAISDPGESYDFFSNANGDFEPGYLDGGASQTWYLAWSAALKSAAGS